MPSHDRTENGPAFRVADLLRRVALIAWLIAAVVGMVVIVGYQAKIGRRFEANRRLASHARDVVIAQEALRSNIHVAEAAAVTYILTGDRRAALDYRADRALAPGLLAETRRSNAPADAVAQNDIANGIHLRLTQLDRACELQSIGQASAAAQSIVGSYASSAQLNLAMDRLIDRQLADIKPLVRRTLLAYQARINGFIAGATLLIFMLAVALMLTGQQLRLRRRAEAQLLDEAAKLTRLTRIIDATSDFVGMATARGQVLFQNKALRSLLGRTVDEDISGSYMHTTHTTESLEIMENDALPTAIRDGIWSGEATFRSHDGEEIPVSQVLLVHKNLDGTISYFSTIARDIRQSKRDHAELLEKQRFVEQIAAASPNVLYLFDLATNRSVYCNTRLIDVLGYSAEQAKDYDDLFTAVMHPDDAAEIAAARAKLTDADDRAVVVIEYRMRHSSGDWRWMRSREMVFKRDAAGVPCQSIGVAEDVTEEKRVLDEMVLERHRLAAIIEAKREIMHCNTNADVAMMLACQHAQAITSAEGAAIMTLDGNDMVFKAATGANSPEVGLRIPVSESLGAICIETSEAIISSDILIDARVKSESIRNLGLRSLMLVPLLDEGRAVGVLCAGSTRPGAFNAGDLHGLSLISEFLANTISRVHEAVEKQNLLDQRTAALELIQRNEALLSSTFHAIDEGLTVITADGTIELCNPAASRILDIPEVNLIGLRGAIKGVRTLRQDGDEFPAGELPSHIALVTGLPVRDVVIGLDRPERDMLWLLVGAVPLFENDVASPSRVVTTFTDITARLAAEKKLNELATSDGLTGIGNHRAFREQITLEMARSARYNHPLSLVMLDVDHFKSFNDTFGHPAGDVVLAHVAANLKMAARTSDFPARYGGEEFAIILPDTDSSGAEIIAERIRAGIENDNWPLRSVTVSVGVATYSPDLTDASDFVARADRALYRAKAQGRNRVCISRRGTQTAVFNQQAA